jgi:type II secretory pathway predicted ATPase ExeA
MDDVGQFSNKSPEVLELIEALVRHQGEVSDARFSKRWLGVHATTWSRIKDGTYAARDWTAVLDKLAGGLRAIEDAAADKSAAHEGRILPLRHVKAVAGAVSAAQHEGRDRLVVYLGQTGSGKSKMGHWLTEYYHGRTVKVEATTSWQDSYLTALVAVAAALGINNVAASRRIAEAAVLEFVAVNPRIIIIDEGHHMGRDALNMCKAILNRGAPGTVLVMLAIPALWDRMCKSAWVEAEQLRNRAKAVIRAPRCLDAEDLAAFLRDRFGAKSWDAFGAAQEAVVQSVRAAVNFGQWAAVERIAAAALDIAENGLVTRADVDTAVAEQVCLA